MFNVLLLRIPRATYMQLKKDLLLRYAQREECVGGDVNIHRSIDPTRNRPHLL